MKLQFEGTRLKYLSKAIDHLADSVKNWVIEWDESRHYKDLLVGVHGVLQHLEYRNGVVSGVVRQWWRTKKCCYPEGG
jgi:hypothetical protein